MSHPVTNHISNVSNVRKVYERTFTLINMVSKFETDCMSCLSLIQEDVK
jgi:hypothetical protein